MDRVMVLLLSAMPVELRRWQKRACPAFAGCELDYVVETEVECPDNDPNDAAFVRATATIRGCDAVKEDVAYKMYPLVVGFSFKSMPLRTTTVSKVETPLSQR
jgi:hypothetical protein